MELKAYAKINLGLKILDKTSDGYHVLDMVMLPISLYDNIKITKRNDELIKVKVTNNIDISTLGDYEVIYEVEDKEGNSTKVVRKVKVEKLKPTQMSVAEYTLDGWYDEVKLKETPNKGNDYFLSY